MNRSDVARLLTLAAAYDSRTIGDTDVAAWALALDGLDHDRCRDAIVRHYRESTDRVMPAHVRRLARTTTDIAHGDTDPGRPCEHGVTCAACKAVHHRHEPCGVLVADDSRWRRALNAFRRPAELTAGPPPEEDDVPQAPRDDWAQTRPLPPPGTGTWRCARCGAAYLDDPDGRDAHRAVFGHQPATDRTPIEEATR